MRKFKEKELLEWLEENIDRYAFLQISHPHLAYYATERDKQAYQQIEEMIKDYAEQQEIEVRYIEIILDLYDRLEKKKPKVDEEFVEKCAIKLVSFVGYPEKARKAKIYSTMQVIREMFKEAGMVVKEKK